LMSRVFEPFDRLGAEQTDVEGTGLGLALSRGLVTAMGGSLTVRSTLDEGSTFTVELAHTDAPDERAESIDARRTDTGIARPHVVLYIEDNVANLRLVQR